MGEKDGVLPVYFTVKLHFALYAALALTTLMGPTVKKVNGPNTKALNLVGGKRADNRWKERIRLPLMELIVDAGRELTLGGPVLADSRPDLLILHTGQLLR